jgi:hypothetical protein
MVLKLNTPVYIPYKRVLQSIKLESSGKNKKVVLVKIVNLKFL